MEFIRIFSKIVFVIKNFFKKVIRLVTCITDNFRMSAFQNETLDWEVVENKAQLAIERCNRTCKSQPMVVPIFLASVHNCVTNVHQDYIMTKIMTMPVVSQTMLLRHMSNYDMLSMTLSYRLNKQVRKYPLPVHMQHHQFQSILGASRVVNQSSIVLRSLLHVCLRCCQQSSSMRNDMRLNFLQKPICVHCNTNSQILTLDTLGHLVHVFRQYYYFCIKCHRVHLRRIDPSTLCVSAACPQCSSRDLTWVTLSQTQKIAIST
jgi:hypothetical protein